MTVNNANNWHSVWSKRVLPESSGTVLEKLIAMDGFDTPLGVMEEADWRNYVTRFAERSGITPADSIFEVGCGSGAFLYPFYEMGQKVSGIDFSTELVKVARSVMPLAASALEATEASVIDPAQKFDVVIANHVIHYFPGMEYAAGVLDAMFRKASKCVSVSGIPDQSLRADSESFRKGMLSDDEYEKKYAGLPILYFQKDWFQQLAEANSFSCAFFEHQMPGFAQNQFRFDCVMKRI
jgi:SAM-dependent methyltransferase